ncbi:hypothetical protein GJ496_005356 [Pomphorhynchus laevis]|nr:hypothetical protein GJ496_005356 [Pomphorhynchus laevis]
MVDEQVNKEITSNNHKAIQPAIFHKPSKPPRCTSCDDANSICQKFCSTCNEYLCDECYNAHIRVRLTKSHKIIEISNNSELNGCQQHSNALLQYFCKACDRGVCGKCMNTSHADHGCVDMTKNMNSILKWIDKLESRQNSLLSTAFLINKLLESTDINEANVIADVTNFASSVISYVKIKEKQLLNEIESKAQLRRQALIKQNKVALNMINKLNDTRKVAELALKNAMIMCKVGKDIEAQFEVIYKDICEVPNFQEYPPSIKFIPDMIYPMRIGEIEIEETNQIQSDNNYPERLRRTEIVMVNSNISCGICRYIGEKSTSPQQKEEHPKPKTKDKCMDEVKIVNEAN